MSAPFLITGLPRSRTAWFSVLTSNHLSHCYHEPVQYAENWDELEAMWLYDKRPYVGMSCSLLAIMLGEILDKVSPRTLIIYRDPAEVVASLKAKGIDSNHLINVALPELEKHAKHHLVRVVAYEALTDPTMVIECLMWLMPNVPIDSKRVRQMMHMRVEADIPYSRRIALDKAGKIGKFLSEEALARLAGQAA